MKTLWNAALNPGSAQRDGAALDSHSTTTTSLLTTRTAALADEEDVVASLTLAFNADPAVRWMYPDPQQFLECFPRFVRAFGGKAFAAQTARCAGNFAGAALWLAPHVQPDEQALAALLQSTVNEQL